MNNKAINSQKYLNKNSNYNTNINNNLKENNAINDIDSWVLKKNEKAEAIYISSDYYNIMDKLKKINSNNPSIDINLINNIYHNNKPVKLKKVKHKNNKSLDIHVINNNNNKYIINNLIKQKVIKKYISNNNSNPNLIYNDVNKLNNKIINNFKSLKESKLSQNIFKRNNITSRNISNELIERNNSNNNNNNKLEIKYKTELLLKKYNFKNNENKLNEDYKINKNILKEIKQKVNDISEKLFNLKLVLKNKIFNYSYINSQFNNNIDVIESFKYITKPNLTHTNSISSIGNYSKEKSKKNSKITKNILESLNNVKEYKNELIVLKQKQKEIKLKNVLIKAKLVNSYIELIKNPELVFELELNYIDISIYLKNNNNINSSYYPKIFTQYDIDFIKDCSDIKIKISKTNKKILKKYHEINDEQKNKPKLLNKYLNLKYFFKDNIHNCINNEKNKLKEIKSKSNIKYELIKSRDNIKKWVQINNKDIVSVNSEYKSINLNINSEFNGSLFNILYEYETKLKELEHDYIIYLKSIISKSSDKNDMIRLKYNISIIFNKDDYKRIVSMLNLYI